MIQIIKPTQKQMIAAIKSGDFSAVNAVNAAAEQKAEKVFDAVVSGSASLIWYDLPPVRCQSGNVSFLRYILTRSTKKENCLQLTCIEIKDGVEIPTSDSQYSIPGDFPEFFRDLPRIANINLLE